MMTEMRTGDPIVERIAAVEKRQDALEKRLMELDEKIDDNTKTTKAIKADTAQLVILIKASVLGASILKWCIGVGSAALVGYAAWKGISQ